MKNPLNVAVIGSCATRDNFYSKFNPSYSDFFKCTVTQNQSSIISLASNPVEVDFKLINNFQEQNKLRDVRSDLSKEVYTNLYKLKPDIVIFDFFADIHFGVIKLNDSQYITNNRWKLQLTDYFKTLKKSKDLKILSIQSDAHEYLKLWKRSFDEIAMYIKLINPECEIIIHKARNVKKLVDVQSKGESLLSESGKMLSIDVEYFNKIWDMMDDYAISKYKLKYVDVFTADLKCPSDHPWGPFYLHYTSDYYHRFLEELIRVTTNKTPFFKSLFVK